MYSGRADNAGYDVVIPANQNNLTERGYVRKIIARICLAMSLIGGGVAITASPAQAHWYHWHQSDCRPDVWYWQYDDGTRYWTADEGYRNVEGPVGNYSGGQGVVLWEYQAQGWECGWLGSPTSDLHVFADCNYYWTYSDSQVMNPCYVGYRQWFQGGYIQFWVSGPLHYAEFGAISN